MAKHDVPVAWIESPLQLIGAAEWAAARGVRPDLAARLGEQVEETAAELHARRAPFRDRAAYYGIPWRMLASHDHWLVGDGYSGQFRLAAAALRPRRITFLDDGANTVPFADALAGAQPYARPGVVERGLTRRLAPIALDAIRMRAAAGAVELFTAFELGEERESRLRDLGAVTTRHGFEWLRSTRPDVAGDPLPSGRVILGSARVVDGHIPRADYLAWVRAEARRRGASYLPHRRETGDTLDAVAAIPGVRVVRTQLPIEVVLAGDRGPYEVVTLPSSAATTLRSVLRGTESTVKERTGAVGGRTERVA
ncbi:hypothetical protein [Microbacterium halophytorum]|uniref:hypothetical protein n=1 Tax=Microbacterium halophytorum TaxID=2067568 RepID=UPI000CFDFA72|nr:hypothetical protein [Microbacterium halophytorum]